MLSSRLRKRRGRSLELQGGPVNAIAHAAAPSAERAPYACGPLTVRLHFGALMGFTRLVVLAAATAAVASSMAPSVAAQTPAAPAYTPARTPDGHPDLQGVWRAWNLAKFDLEDHGAKPGVPAGRGFVVDPADGKIPYRPEALERRQKNYEGTKTADPITNTDPLAKCYLPGVPRLTYLGWPFQIIQDKQDVNFTVRVESQEADRPDRRHEPPAGSGRRSELAMERHGARTIRGQLAGRRAGQFQRLCLV